MKKVCMCIILILCTFHIGSSSSWYPCIVAMIRLLIFSEISNPVETLKLIGQHKIMFIITQKSKFYIPFPSTRQIYCLPQLLKNVIEIQRTIFQDYTTLLTLITQLDDFCWYLLLSFGDFWTFGLFLCRSLYISKNYFENEKTLTVRYSSLIFSTLLQQ